MVLLGLAIATLATAAVSLGFVILIWKGYLKQLKAARADINSFSNEVKKMRESPPKVRIPYEARLKAEYEKRGMKWETTTKS